MIYSSMTYIIFTLLHNLLDFRQVNLFKRAKHWDSFFTHCMSSTGLAMLTSANSWMPFNTVQYIFAHTHVQYRPGDVDAFQLADALQYIFMHAHVQYWPSNVDACQLMNALQSIFANSHVQYQPGDVDA